MPIRPWEDGRTLESLKACEPGYETEYAALQKQRLSLIWQYNVWYAIGFATSISTFWLLAFMSLSVASLPLLVAAAMIGTISIAFGYHVVMTIDRDVVALYPRIIFLELVLDLDFYRDYLRRRPRGETERSYIERCEQIDAETTTELWREVYSHFHAKDFPGSRRITTHFRAAALLVTAMYWVVVAIIVLPQYFGTG